MVQSAGSQGGPRGAALPRGHAPERGGHTAPAPGGLREPRCPLGIPLSGAPRAPVPQHRHRARTAGATGNWGEAAAGGAPAPPQRSPVLPARRAQGWWHRLSGPGHAVLRAGTGRGAGLPSWGLLTKIALVKVGRSHSMGVQGVSVPRGGCGLPDRVVGLPAMCLPCSANARYPGSDILGEPPSLRDALALSSEDISVPCAGEKTPRNSCVEQRPHLVSLLGKLRHGTGRAPALLLQQGQMRSLAGSPGVLRPSPASPAASPL